MYNISFWAFPLNLVLALSFALLLYLCSKSSWRMLQWVRRWRCVAVSLLAIIVVVAVEGTWGYRLHSHVGYALLQLVLMIPLGVACLRESRQIRKHLVGWFSHVGLLLILGGGLFGAPDMEDCMMIVNRVEAEHYAYKPDGKLVPMPFGVRLSDFRIDYYDDGVSPKQFTSVLLVEGKEMETSVNHPCSHKGWNIYQSDYDWAEGNYSVLKMVRDPWLPVVYLGMALLAIGAVLGLKQTWKGRWVLPVVGLLTVAFSFLSLARINFGTLMPALRSLWFVPHLIIYMVAYSVLAIATVLGAMVAFRSKRIPADLPRKLLATSSSLLIIGMLCGAVWAKAAWGDYWTWDAKECWAAVTWMLTLVGMHLPHRDRSLWPILFVWLSFLSMQITWYGVNYLPASENSMHTYNR